MTWNYDRSRDRIQAHLDVMGDITVEKLIREADLSSLLSETNCREIFGAHVYVQISNFPHLASQDADDNDSYKELIRAVHIYQREVGRIVESVQIFDALRVHFQGPKLHALLYRPIDDDEELAARAVLLQLVIKDFVKSVFNPAFTDCDDFLIAGGADLGDVVGTRNGSKGDRELLFIGSPANIAAKIISSAGRLRITGNIYDALGEDLKEICEDIGDDLYTIAAVSREQLDDLLERYDIGWNSDASAKRIDDDIERFPLTDVYFGSAEIPIDLDALSIRNSKRVVAASIFADVSGFTRYIEACKTEADKKSALRVFHAIRKEMSRVVRNDFKGLRIQFQGDRAQGLFHLPKDNEERIIEKAVNTAIGIQSSMEHAIKDCLPEAAELAMAVGIDIGQTLVSKLGTRAHRDRICLGEAVESAAMNEENVDGKQIGISKGAYDVLPTDLKQHFSYDRGAGCYVATGLTADRLELAAKAAVYQSGGAFFIKPSSSGITIGKEESVSATKVVPARSYAPES